MDSFEKLKSKRAKVLISVAKLIKKFTLLLLVAVDDIDCYSLMKSLEILKENENSLQNLDA